MNGKTYSSSLFLWFCVASQFYEKPVTQEDNIQLKVAAYNVEYSAKGSATEIGEMLSPYNFDIVCFSEAPGGDWTKEVAKAMGMDHVVVGQYSTAGHEDKYKTIASRTPLHDYEEILMADTLHTVTKAITQIDDQEIAIYSVHFPFGWRDQAHIDETTAKVTAFVDYLKDKQSGDAVPVVMGDFNFTLSNSSYTSRYYEMFVEIGLDASWPDLGIDVSRLATMVKYEPEENNGGGVIDHIMYNSSNTKALDGHIIEIEKPLSDHKPVWALLQINKN
jgi:maltose 6'-phosphate phosphatase